MAKIIGIDLGTSNSAAAILEAGRPKIIPSAEGASLYGKAFPSVVGFLKDGSVLVGEPARRQAVSNPTGTIMAAKRKMGTDFKYKIHGKEYTPQQISAFVLQKIKRDAEAFLGAPVTKAVITVPAYFNDDQRQATKDAGQIAGLEVIRIINEPTAAALAYGLDKGSKKSDTILVFDLGGGTLDVTIMEFGDGVFEVKSTSGDTQLGGTDMDNTVINHVVKTFKDNEGIDLSDDDTAMQRVREAAEKAKIELSTTLETELNLPFLSVTTTGPKHLSMKMTRAQLEKMLDPLVQRCHKSVEQAIKDAKLSMKEVSKVILVGGPTRMPMVQRAIESWTGHKPERSIDPMECVAMGAAIQAGVLAGDVKDVLLLDVTPLSLGIETLGGVFTKLIDRNTTIPVKKSQIFSTATDNQPAVTIRIAQGERPMFNDNKALGQFDLVGIPPAQRGIPQIEVTFDIDANGILHVTAKDKATAKEQSLKITAPNKLSEAEIEKMRKAAEAHADEDKRRKDEVELVNQADTLVYTTEKTFKELEGKVPEKETKAIKDKVDALKKLLEAKDKDYAKLKSVMDELNEIAQKASAELYKHAQEKAAKEGAGSHPHGDGSEHGAHGEGHGHDDNVVDAEVVDKKGAKKK